MKRHKQRTMFLSAIGFSLLTRASYLLANPQAPTVIAGSAVFNVPDPSTLQVTTSEQAIINWNAFSIASGELTQFIQPGANSAVLNRVTGGDLSAIMGALRANGRVYLINPNGILVGKDAVINTNSFVASTLDVDNAQFLQDGDLLFTGDGTAGVVNLGKITAANGDVILIGYTVDNQGEINAPEGGARAYAGQELILHKDGDEKITVRVKTPAQEADGTGVNQAGTIQALTAELKADGNLYNLAINHSGTTEAKGIVSHNGQVYLYAENGLNQITGNIKAENVDGTGGTVHILGDEISFPRKACIDVAGDHGGGTLLVGGDYQGKNENIPNAAHVYVGPQTHFHASAYQDGDAGKVVVWADQTTTFYGSVDGRGGAQGGDGGFTEVSGKQYLDYNGIVDLRAENGQTGNLLLDPTNLAISSSADLNINPNPDVFPINAPNTNSNLNNLTLQAALNLANLTVQTGADGGTGAGDINWEASGPVAANSPFNLTVESANDLNIDATFSNAGTGTIYYHAQNNINLRNTITTATTQPVVLEAANDFNVQSSITNTADGKINLTAGNALNIGTPAQTVAVAVTNTATDASPISLTGREVTFYGEAAAATTVGTTTASGPVLVTSTGGNINVQGNTAITSLYEVDLHAYNGDIRIDPILSAAVIATGSTIPLANTSLNAYQGDIVIENCDVQISGQNNTTLNAPIGSIQIQGNSVNNPAVTQTNVNATTGTLNLIASENLTATGGFNSQVVLHGNKVDINVGGDVRLEGTTLTGSGQGSVQIFGVSGFEANIGNDLIMRGGGDGAGGAPASFALIRNTTSGDLNLTVGNDVLLVGGNSLGSIVRIENDGPGAPLSVDAGGNIHLIAGSGSQANVQIGAFSSSNQGPIDITAGQDITLDSSNAGDVNSFALIGHGLAPFIQVAGTYIGDISITGGPATDLNLIGGPGTFAQIGHPGSMNALVTNAVGPSDILVNHIGGNINLDPQGGYAVIGHGNAFNPAGNVPSITGNITVNDVGGNVNLNPGTTANSFAQIGSYNATTITGDITVAAAGDVNLTTGNFANNTSIIGQGNTRTPNAAAVTSNIQVNALNVNLNAGSNLTATNGTAAIGFVSGTAVAGQTLTIRPDSTIAVHASEDVTVQAGWGTVAGGNAVIGHIAQAAAPARINHIDVTADIGNIDIYGGSSTGLPFVNGAALIGTASLAATTTLPESDVNVNAPNGQVSVFGLTPGLGTTTPGVIGGGLAAITNSSFASPFDVTVNAQNVLVSGSDSSGLINDAFIRSGRNTTVTVNDNLRVLGAFGSARISSLGGFATFDVGGNVDVVAGNFPAQIGNNVPFTADCPITFTHVGGNVRVQGGTGTASYAEIGHGQGTTTGTTNGDITFTEIGGNVYVQGGSNSSFTFAQIGHSGNVNVPISALGDILLENVVGNVNVNGGTSIGSAATIGHSNTLATSQNSSYAGEVHVKANSAYMTGGASNLSPAVIGYSTPPTLVGSSFTSQLVNVELDGALEITAGTDGNAYIGYYNRLAFPTSVNIRNINVEAIDGNVQLTAGGTGSAAIGTVASLTSAATSQIKVTTNKDVVLNGGSSSLAVATIANASNTTINANDVIIDPSSIILLANSGQANIYSSNNLNISYDDSFYINYDALNPSVIQSGPASVSAQRNIAVNTNNESVGDLVIQGGTPAINSSLMQSFLGDIIIGTRTHTGAGNVTIGTPQQVGAASMIAENIFINAFGDLDVIGSSGSNAGNSSIEALRRIEVINGGHINIVGNAAQASITSQAGSIELTSGDSITIGTNGEIDLTIGDGDINLVADEDVALSANGNIHNAGDGQTTIDAGRDLTLANTANITNDGSGDIITKIGRDTTLANSSTITPTAGGNFTNTSGRDFRMSDTTNITTTGESDISITAGRDIALTNSATIFHNASGQLKLNAGDSFTMANSTIVATQAGDMHVTTGQDAVFANTAEFNNFGNGETTFNLGRDLIVTNDAIILNAGSGDILIDAKRDTSLSDTASIRANGGGDVIDHSGRNVTLSDLSHIDSTGNSLMTITAGDSIILEENAALNHNSTGILTLQAGLDLTLTDNASVNSNGDVHTSAGQDTTLSDASSINVNAGGDFTNTSVRNFELSGTSSVNTNGHSLMTINAGNSITLSDTSTLNHDSTGILTLNAGVDITLNDGSSVTSRGDVHTTAGQDTVLNDSSFIDLTNGGDFTNTSMRNFELSGTSSVTTNGHSLMTVNAGNSITLSDTSILDHNSTGILTLNAGVDITLNDGSRVTSRGDVHTTAGQDTVLNDTSSIALTNGGDFTNKSARNFVMSGTSNLTTNQDGNIDVVAGHSILVSESATINHNSTGTMNLTAVEDVALSNNALVRTTAGNINVKAGQDTTLTDNAAISNLGNGQTTVDSGRDIVLSQNTSIINVGSGDILTEAGRDTTLNDASRIIAQSGGNFENTSGRNFTMSGTSVVRTTGSSLMTIEAGNNISLSDDSFIDHNSRGILTLTAGEDILVSDIADINTRGDLYAKAGQDMVLSQSADVVNLENGETNIDVVRDFRMRNRSTLINEGSGDITVTAGRDTRLSGSSTIEAEEGGNYISTSGRDFKMEGSSKVETHGESFLTVEAGREIELEDRAFIDHDARGVLCLHACQDIEIEDQSTVRTEHGDGHLEAGRDIHVEDQARVLAEGARPLDFLAHYDIRVIDDAIVANSGSGDLTMIADHNMDLLNNAQVTTNGGNLHLVVDNDWPCPPFYGVGRIYKDTNVTVSTNGGALRIFTSVRGFNTILGLLNGIPFFPGIEFVNTPLEQWNSYYLMAFNGHPYTIFYKNGGIPQRPINPSVVNNFRIATNEGFYDWRVVDQFLFSRDYFSAEACLANNDDCCDPCEDEGNVFVKFYRYIRKKYLNYHTKQLDQL